MIGQIATTAISTNDGATMNVARRRSGSPRERRLAGAEPAVVEATAMALEGGQRLRDLVVGGLQRLVRRLLARERGIDVVVDRLRDLGIDRRDRPGVRLRHGLLELLGERIRLLD